MTIIIEQIPFRKTGAGHVKEPYNHREDVQKQINQWLKGGHYKRCISISYGPLPGFDRTGWTITMESDL